MQVFQVKGLFLHYRTNVSIPAATTVEMMAVVHAACGCMFSECINSVRVVLLLLMVDVLARCTRQSGTAQRVRNVLGTRWDMLVRWALFIKLR